MKVEVVLCVERVGRCGGREGTKGKERRREGRGEEWRVGWSGVKWKERRGEEDGVCGERRAGRGGGGEGGGRDLLENCVGRASTFASPNWCFFFVCEVRIFLLFPCFSVFSFSQISLLFIF